MYFTIPSVLLVLELPYKISFRKSKACILPHVKSIVLLVFLHKVDPRDLHLMSILRSFGFPSLGLARKLTWMWWNMRCVSIHAIYTGPLTHKFCSHTQIKKQYISSAGVLPGPYLLIQHGVFGSGLTTDSPDSAGPLSLLPRPRGHHSCHVQPPMNLSH